MNSLLSFIKALTKKSSPLLTRVFGITLLSKVQTEAYLAAKAEPLLDEAGGQLLLAAVTSSTADKKLVFGEQTIDTASRRVWRVGNQDGKSTQLRNGSIVIDGKALDMGFGNRAIAKDLLRINTRHSRAVEILLAPWGYYWTGYFDYIFFIAVNLYRIKETLSPEEFAKAVVCYPLFHAGFEQEILELICFKPEHILDSRDNNVSFDTCIVANNDSWFYANKEDVFHFKKYLESKLPLLDSPHKRIYIQRAGRRKVVNEPELLALLKRYDFYIVEDTARTFIEQVTLYHNATFIIGPHGASFANILWCRPGTQLFELFPNTYMPDYFRYLAQVLELNYAAYCLGQRISSAHLHVEDDVLLDLAEVEQQLSSLLEAPAASPAQAAATNQPLR